MHEKDFGITDADEIFVAAITRPARDKLVGGQVMLAAGEEGSRIVVDAIT